MFFLYYVKYAMVAPRLVTVTVVSGLSRLRSKSY